MEINKVQPLIQQKLRQGGVLKTPDGSFFLLQAQLSKLDQQYGLTLLFRDPEADLSSWLSYRITHFDADKKTEKIYLAYSRQDYVQIESADPHLTKRALLKAGQEYLELTNQVLPQLARKNQWPIRENHCFQRILLDHLFAGPWYAFLPKGNKPAYRQLNIPQLGQLLQLTHRMCAMSRAEVIQFNDQSLAWRQKKNPAQKSQDSST